MDDIRQLVEACAGIAEAVRAPGQGDVALATDEVVILFEAPEEAQGIYDLLTGAGGGVKLLEPGEVVLRVLPEWNQASLNFAPMVRYWKPEIIAAVLDAIGPHVEEAVLADAEACLAEDVAALVEMNPYHAHSDGKFASPGELKAAKKGSHSAAGRKRKVAGANKKKGLILKAAKRPCGREAREAGRNQRCWDGQKLSWTGHAVARVIRKHKRTGRMEGVLTADDRVILERAVAAWAARAAEIAEGFGSRAGRWSGKYPIGEALKNTNKERSIDFKTRDELDDAILKLEKNGIIIYTLGGGTNGEKIRGKVYGGGRVGKSIVFPTVSEKIRAEHVLSGVAEAATYYSFGDKK